MFPYMGTENTLDFRTPRIQMKKEKTNDSSTKELRNNNNRKHETAEAIFVYMCLCSNEFGCSIKYML